MMMKWFCIVVVVLVVVARDPVSGAKKDGGRPVVNPIIRVAVIESCIQREREQYKNSHGGKETKFEIRHVGDMTYKVMLIICQICLVMFQFLYSFDKNAVVFSIKYFADVSEIKTSNCRVRQVTRKIGLVTKCLGHQF